MDEWSRSLKAIRRHPGVSCMVVLTLALGIGANTAIFSAVDGVLLRPLPYRGAGRLVALFQHEVRKASRRNPTSPADFLAWAKETQTLEQMTAAHPWGPVLTGRGQPEPIPGLKATVSLFELLGAKAALGQTFALTAGAPETDVLVLSDRLWQRRFGGDPRIVGQALVLDGRPYTVLGVMPPGFQFPPFWATGAEMWTPLRLTAESETNHGQFLRAFARRKAGVTLAQAQAEMDLIARRLATERPASNTGIAVNVEALHEPVVSRVRPALLVLFGAVAFVLLIACANVASLLLARGLSREKEVALRAALGAGRGRIARELLTENVVLALVGGFVGLWLAGRGLAALRLFGPEGFPRLDEIRLDGRVAVFNLAVSVLTGIVSGLLPALRASRTDLANALKQGDRVAGAGSRHRLHDFLVVGEFALALVLLIGAGLMGRSFLRLLRPEPGFRPEGVLTMSLSFSNSPMREAARQNAFFDEVLRRARSVPGFETAALVNHLPIAGDTWSMEFTVEGQAPPAAEVPSAVYRAVTPDYLRSMGIPLLGGRPFGDHDQADTGGVALVNRTLARRSWPDADAVGQRIRPGGRESDGPWLTVVGVVGDARQASLTEPVRPEILFPYTQNPVAWYRSTTLVVRAKGDPLNLAEPLKAEIWAVDGTLPVTQVRSMAEILSDSVGQERFNASLLGTFAATALLLATVGIYGVMAYTVTRRKHEIGIRMALGARPGEVFALIVGRGLRLGALGAALGLAGALALSRFLASLLFEVPATDPATFAAITGLLMAVSFLACAVPALRATRVDPLIALRD